VCGFDDLHRVARVLEVHNKWRRGDIEIDEAPCPSAVGKAIDAAIAHLRFNVGGEARLAAHQPSHTTTATPQGVASTD
jgi:hypothetical protein